MLGDIRTYTPEHAIILYNFSSPKFEDFMERFGYTDIHDTCHRWDDLHREHKSSSLAVSGEKEEPFRAS